ncbi:MAG: class I SAM-dependent methyltransferase [Candidatus Omnitrophota bacterium]|nr:class I SAM-dependent methyltransferase [Candidatus Omnitrophota bacterium]
MSETQMQTGRMDWVREYLKELPHCPLCHGRGATPLLELGPLRVWRCKDCRLMYLNPCLFPDEQKMIFSSPDFLTRVSEFFADYYQGETWNTPRTLAVYNGVMRELASLFPAKGKIVDIGCGRGAFLKAAKAGGWTASGVEPNFDDAEHLRRDHDIEVFQGDFFEAALPESGFDVVSMWDLIEHVPEPGDWVRRCAKLLRPGGALLLATPNHFSFLDFLAFTSYRLSFGNFSYALEKLYTVDHTLYLTQHTLRDLFERSGFTVVKTIKVNTDLSRYAMGPLFRGIAEGLLAVGGLMQLHNRVIMIAIK